MQEITKTVTIPQITSGLIKTVISEEFAKIGENKVEINDILNVAIKDQLSKFSTGLEGIREQLKEKR